MPLLFEVALLFRLWRIVGSSVGCIVGSSVGASVGASWVHRRRQYEK